MLATKQIHVPINGNRVFGRFTPIRQLEKRMFGKLKKLFGTNHEIIKLDREINLAGNSAYVENDGQPLMITVGGKILHLYPTPSLDKEALDRDANKATELLLVDPEQYFNGISGFKRIQLGNKLIIGRSDAEQVLFFSYSKRVAMRHLTVELNEGGILLKDLSSDSGSRVAPLKEDTSLCEPLTKRQSALQTIEEMYGSAYDYLEADEAYSLLVHVNTIIANEVYRCHNHEGKPGALVEIPDDKHPIILGDIHTNLDNLINILSENHFMDSLLNDKACLIILGDAAHCEFDGQEGEMDSSLLIMDFIFRLKVLLPNNFFYLRGNHDSFSPQIRKAGINQGALWKKKVVDTRGKKYLKAMQDFYTQLPMVAIGKDFITCHAGPTKNPISREELINLREGDTQYHELLWTRVKSARQPAGYVAATVKNFRRGLDYQEAVSFIVGHTPPTQDETLWIDVGGIKNHHVLFNSRLEGVPVFTRIGDSIIPLKYKYEKIIAEQP